MHKKVETFSQPPDSIRSARRVRPRARRAVAVFATGRNAATMLSRVTAAGCESITVFERAEDFIAEFTADRFDLVVAMLEPTILSRESLHQLDLLGVRTVGVVAHHRHRAWAALLPLRETVWLFAPASMYRRQMLVGGSERWGNFND